MTTWVTDRTAPAAPPITLREAVARATPRPVLLLTAGEVPDEQEAAEWIRAGAPDSVTVVEQPDTGHTAGLRTDPERWEATVVGFLDEQFEDQAERMSRRSTPQVPRATRPAVVASTASRLSPMPSLTGCSPMAQCQGDHERAPSRASLRGSTKPRT